MDLWLVFVLYFVGLGLIMAETMLPGVVMGLIGLGLLGTSAVFGFRHHWMIGTSQIVVAAGVIPFCFYLAIRRLRLNSSLEGAVSFAREYSAYVGKEGETQTDLRPAGIVLIDGQKVDVVTSGEAVSKGSRVRVLKVEGNRIVVRAT